MASSWTEPTEEHYDGKYYVDGAIKVCSKGRMTIRDMPTGGVSVEIDAMGRYFCRDLVVENGGPKSPKWCEAFQWPLAPKPETKK